jgi:hypothetical protein
MILIPPFLTLLLIIWAVKAYRAEVRYAKDINEYSKTKRKYNA